MSKKINIEKDFKSKKEFNQFVKDTLQNSGAKSRFTKYPVGVPNNISKLKYVAFCVEQSNYSLIKNLITKYSKIDKTKVINYVNLIAEVADQMETLSPIVISDFIIKQIKYNNENENNVKLKEVSVDAYVSDEDGEEHTLEHNMSPEQVVKIYKDSHDWEARFNDSEWWTPSGSYLCFRVIISTTETDLEISDDYVSGGYNGNIDAFMDKFKKLIKEPHGFEKIYNEQIDYENEVHYKRLHKIMIKDSNK